uniref:Mammalian ependymin-related protein 1 n=1 Tax=Ciona savignyi TaxID=51511 RepID=H2ZDI0_CIOSA
MKFLVLLAVFCVVTYAQEGPSCGAPGIFQARVRSYDHETNYFRDGRFSYDAFEQKERMIEVIQENATRPQIDELVLHREKKRYTVDLKTRKCNVTTIDYPFHRIEVDEPARFLGYTVIGLIGGAPGEGMDLGIWEHHVEGQTVRGNLTQSFTRDECIPISEVFYGETIKTKEMIHFHRTYLDVTLGLDSADVFEIPKECMHRH